MKQNEVVNEIYVAGNLDFEVLQIEQIVCQDGGVYEYTYGYGEIFTIVCCKP